MVRATSSLPVPLSPVISTEAVLGATISIRRKISCILREEPTIGPITPLSRSLRRVDFQFALGVALADGVFAGWCAGASDRRPSG